MQNTKTDANNILHIGGGQDSYCKLLIHFDGADADTADQTAATGQTVSLEGNACLDTAYKQFGSAALLLDGTGDYCTVPDSADWYFGANPFTIDVQLKHVIPDSGEGTVTRGICGQYVDDNNYWRLYYTTAWTGITTFYFEIKSGGTVKASYSFAAFGMTSSFTHIEFVRNGSNLYLFWNGSSRTATVTTAISTNEVPNLAAVLEIGATSNHANLYKGHIDEFRISKGIARHTADFTVPSSPYLPDWRYFLIGSPRPLKGIKAYVSLANTVASTLTGKVWNGSTWDTLTLTDNTDTGASLAQTGTITFATTVTTAKPKYLEGYFLYWYQFYLDAGEAEIYKVTMDAPFQSIIDLWDGQYRDISAAYKMGQTSRSDIALKVLRDDYDTDTADTYADLSSLAAYNGTAYWLEFGFVERQCGLHFRLPPDYTNSTASTVMSVDYWNGTAYTSVGAVSDGTSEGSISFAKSGTVTWNNANISDETKTQKMQAQTVWNPLSDPTTTESIWGWTIEPAKYVATPLYFYRVKFNQAMDASVRLNYVGGISSQKNISHYKFPIFAQGRILLCCDMSEEKNKMTCSGKYLPQVYNGTDSVDIYFGEEGELNCGVELFSQYNGNLYSMILMFKDTEMWIVAGQDIKAWESNIFPVSMSIGCPAPQTLKTINLVAEPGQGINRSLAIWQGTNGIYMSDGRSPIPIHGDIKEYFDKNDSRCIKASMVGSSIAFMDYTNQEYHWLFASGTSATTLNTELVYDVKRNKWFEIDRGTGMDLQCGVEVIDLDGNQYTYGFIDTGYMERLEYGTNFDGNSIVHTFQTGDFAPLGLSFLTQLDHLKMLTVAKTTTSSNVTLSHYTDTLSAAIKATGTITIGSNVADNDTLTIDGKTYTFKTTLTPTEGQVLIGATAAITLDNLKLAVNRTDPGTNDGVKYKIAAAHSTVEATTNTDTVQTIQALVAGATELTVSKSASTLTCTHVTGGKAASIDHTMSPANSGYRIAKPYFDDKVQGDPYHSLKCTITTTDETCGFEPIALIGTFHAVQED
jgi:hypothetical protein